jgi:hypothetical protein
METQTIRKESMTYINDMCIHCSTDYTCWLEYPVCDGTGCIDYICCDGEVD